MECDSSAGELFSLLCFIIFGLYLLAVIFFCCVVSVLQTVAAAVCAVCEVQVATGGGKTF